MEMPLWGAIGLTVAGADAIAYASHDFVIEKIYLYNRGCRPESTPITGSRARKRQTARSPPRYPIPVATQRWTPYC